MPIRCPNFTLFSQTLLFPGESRLIGSDDPIMVAPGTDVILPCRLEFEMDLVNKTIEWSRVGEKTEPAKQKSLKTYVFLYRRGIQITAMMMQSYIQRTSMFDDRLRRGDMSLKISNVTFEDNGIYECSLPRRQQRAKVLLVVSEFGMQFCSVGPSLWINQSSGEQQRPPDFPLPGHFLQLFWGDPEAFQRPAEKHSVFSMSWVFPGASAQWDMLGTLHQGGVQEVSGSDVRITLTGSSTPSTLRVTKLLTLSLRERPAALQRKLISATCSVTAPPPSTVMVEVGADAVLPCHLGLAVNPSTLRMECFRSDLTSDYVFVWVEGRERVNQKPQLYQGRTSVLFDTMKLEEVSLNLANVTALDEGTYICRVPRHGRSCSVQLLRSGSTPSSLRVTELLTLSLREQLWCKSAGWHPKPNVSWLDETGKLLPAESVETLRDADGLFKVSSRVSVDKRWSQSATCRLQSVAQSRETSVQIRGELSFTFILTTHSHS
uniref:Butyrophilin subfamily 2 member A2-like n=1 Tax=Oryzias melastigma TaxID=30732 RepID=A0A3B3CUY0_ORYME